MTNENKVLMAVTTANQIEYTKMFYDSFIGHKPNSIDLIFIDDASNDGTPEYLIGNGERVVSKKKPMGLTNSWNLAYKIFKRENYSGLILSNNDLLISRGSIDGVIQGLIKYDVVGAMSSQKGVFHQPLQAVDNYYDIKLDPENPKNYEKISELVLRQGLKNTYVELEYINGFFFGINRSVIKTEYSLDCLFDPRNINVSNEDELCEKVRMSGGKIALSAISFIFHFKGKSFAEYGGEGYRFERNLTWDKVEKLRKKDFKFQVYRIFRKVKEVLGIGIRS